MTNKSEGAKTWQPIEQPFGVTAEQQQQLRDAVSRTLAIVGPQDLREYAASHGKSENNIPKKA